MTDEREQLVVHIRSLEERLGVAQDEVERLSAMRAVQVAALVALPGMSVRRAGDLLGISPTAVQKAIERARSVTPATS